MQWLVATKVVYVISDSLSYSLLLLLSCTDEERFGAACEI